MTNITEGVGFGVTLALLTAGQKVARSGWNGKDMFIFYVPENLYPASGNKFGTLTGLFENDLVPYMAYIAMKTVDNKIVPWLASQTDILAEDWHII